MSLPLHQLTLFKILNLPVLGILAIHLAAPRFLAFAFFALGFATGRSNA